MISYHQLEQFGLNNKESMIYLAALELGTDTVQNIAKKANIHRVTTYDILESLITKGLVSQIIKGKKRYFIAVEPEKILDGLKNKEQLFSTLLPELKALQDKAGQKPKVMYFEGREAVWNAFLDRIRHKPELKENLVYGSSEELLTAYPEGYKEFTKERLSKGIKARIIVERSKSGLWEQKKSKEHIRQVKFWPEGKKFKANTIIYGDRMLIISWESKLAVIIEDKNNADNQRMLFEMLWDFLPE